MGKPSMEESDSNESWRCSLSPLVLEDWVDEGNMAHPGPRWPNCGIRSLWYFPNRYAFESCTRVVLLRKHLIPARVFRWDKGVL
jgi:hypothetical protein